ncbi:S8 family serine peptidase [Pseudoduganella sp. FT55W]|uniref:S8 family serine peptidase n=1 Tax=Duganella rivi TaxID=2666083 RepID=A0A7X4GQY3_9BURK|nr:S8 family serine peptidase [Duganella rivi]MYM67034.1 S8 family serine peptidase [Duganella rivi]
MLLRMLIACLLWWAIQAQAAAPAPEDADAHQLLVMLRLPAPHYRPDASYGGRYLDDAGRSARRNRAEALARQHGLTLVDDWAMPMLGVDCYVMRYPANDSAERLIALLESDPQVEWAQPVARFAGMQQADALYPVQPAARFWHVAELHRYTTGRDIKVAVIDSGIDTNHPDLQGQVALNQNFVDAGPTPPENHGTAVAGIIAARAGHGGIVGVAPQAKVMGLRACWQQPDANTRCNSFTLGKALNFAIQNGAQIINLSLSGPPDRLLDRLLDVALERSISIVGAIDAQASGPSFPANHRGVLAVATLTQINAPTRPQVSAATAPTAERTPGGAVQTDAPLLAPGSDVPTTAPGGRWSFVSGSSYAAAHVSGMLALLDQLQPGASPARLRSLLQSGAAPTTATIDACSAVARLVQQLSCPRALSQRGGAP